MKVELPNMSLAVILDISGMYAHIHDQSYCNREKLEQLKGRYSDTTHWKIVVLDF